MHEHLYAAITGAATSHGLNSEPDHEVGDLQEAVEQLIGMLTEDQILSILLGDDSPIKSLISDHYEDEGLTTLFQKMVSDDDNDMVDRLTSEQMIKFVREDMEIETKEPDEDSSYNNSFVGLVVGIRAEHGLITIRDGEDEHFDIEPSEIERLVF